MPQVISAATNSAFIMNSVFRIWELFYFSYSNRTKVPHRGWLKAFTLKHFESFHCWQYKAVVVKGLIILSKENTNIRLHQRFCVLIFTESQKYPLLLFRLIEVLDEAFSIQSSFGLYKINNSPLYSE